jgi:CelD/BcsL family acetyltransferase involved in cellulose biosynthesis
MDALTRNTGLSPDFVPSILPGDINRDEERDKRLIVRCHSNLVELEMMSQQWDALLTESETNTVHQLFAWTEVWWQILSRGRELFVLSVWQGDQLVGVAPLMRSTQRKHGRKARVLEFIGSGSVNYLDFIVGANKQRIMESMLDWLSDNRDEWDMLNLLHIPETSASTAIIQNYFHCRQISTRIVNSGTCPVYICSGDLEADLKITKKKTEQRYYNHYSKSGSFEFKICETIEEVETYLPAMFEQHIARFCHIPRSNKYVDPLQREFVRAMSERLLPAGIPVFSVALFNGQPIAIQYGFHYQNKFTGYLLTYDLAETKTSPGRLMIKLIMTEMIRRGITEFDFGRGGDEYKMRFTNCIRENQAVTVYADLVLSILATVSHAKDSVTESVKQSIKSKSSFKPVIERYLQLKRLIKH